MNEIKSYAPIEIESEDCDKILIKRLTNADAEEGEFLFGQLMEIFKNERKSLET